MTKNQVLKQFEGDGTKKSPILITSADDLLALEDPKIGQAGFYFKQAKDISINDQFGYTNIKFIGHYNGNEKEIHRSDPDPDATSTIFKTILNSEISNLKVNTGLVLTEESENSIFSNCETDNRISKSSKHDTIKHCITNTTFVNTAIETQFSQCVTYYSIAKENLQDCVVADTVLDFDFSLEPDIDYSTLKNIIADSTDETTLNQVYFHLKNKPDMERFTVFKAHRYSRNPLIKVTINNSLFHSEYPLRVIGSHRREETPSSMISNRHMWNHYGRAESELVLISNNNHHLGLISGLDYSQRIPDSSFDLEYLRDNLHWNFTDIWQWNHSKKIPELRNAGFKKPETSQANLKKLKQQLEANIWIGA